MRHRTASIYMADFETTVYEGQVATEVWAAALVKLGEEEVNIYHSIREFWEAVKRLPGNSVIYFHNLKFDGSFLLDLFLRKLQFRQALIPCTNVLGKPSYKWKETKELSSGEIKYNISDKGIWYNIIVKYTSKTIEFRDSLKLLPFSVKAIGGAFKTKHQKLEMEYEGFRYAGCNITPEEQEYIKNDVLVMNEAMKLMYDEGHTNLTIGACCMSEYRKILKTSLTAPLEFDEAFPDVYDSPLDATVYGEDSIGEYVHKAYHGGWCYVVRGCEGKIFGKGTTADVNSLYPSMMHSISGNRYPVGYGHMWKGNFIPPEALGNDRYYFIRIKTKFYIRDGKLPFIQIKGNWLYNPRKMLETSDIEYNGKHYKKAMNNGVPVDVRVTLTLTMTDYNLMLEHYQLVDFEILDGCWFYSEIGMFDDYIDKWAEVKMKETGARRTLAKLYLNNLYGKFATYITSSFKIAHVMDNGAIGFEPIYEEDKKPGYIPVGAAITSYSRNFTIRAAQKNYHGPDKPGFKYADTDSIHCDLPPDKIEGITVDPVKFCCWKLEACWDKAKFVRPKTYLEHVTHEDLEPIGEPYWNVKCAGMPENCKQLYLASIGEKAKLPNKLRDEEIEFLATKRTLDDFDIGLKVPSKLAPKRIPGGILLVNTTFEMRG